MSLSKYKNTLFLQLKRKMVLWPSGLGKALQKLLHQFDSGRDLKKTLPQMGGFLNNMFSKIIYPIGIIACILLIVSCFLPWAYYSDSNIPEAQRTFTGFFSYQNYYGKPGMFLVPLAVIILIFKLLPKIWAKRTNLFLAALLLGYSIKTTVMYAGCSSFYCPDKKTGLYLMLIAAILILLAAIFPYGGKDIPQEKKS